ncbi:hypothetical protein [Streptomyces pactum]|uniref:hypothetical protein n=1 Tax=Streptomyces pactum TaxID=68249 RepID=UPI0036F74AC6
MELDPDQKRKGFLALAVLGLLLVAVLVVFTVFDGEEDGRAGGGGTRPTATGEPGGGDLPPGGDTPPGGGGTSGGGTGAAGGDVAELPEPQPVVPMSEVGAAHEVMARYLAGTATYDHASDPEEWRRPLTELITDDTAIRDETSLPTGQEWDQCKADRCTSRGKATVMRDALVSNDLVKGGGRQISTVIQLDTTRTAKGERTTESNLWLVTAVSGRGGDWKVSGISLFGLGNVGSSDQAG